MWRGAPHMAKGSMINLCVYGVPHSPYIKEWRREGTALSMARPRGGVLLPVGVGFPPSLVGVGEEGRGRGREGKPPPIRIGLGGRAPPTWPPPPLFHHGPLRPINSPGGNVRTHPKHFRCPNIVVQYINLYVSTISRLLVMSVITSGTPNNLRSPG